MFGNGLVMASARFALTAMIFAIAEQVLSVRPVLGFCETGSRADRRFASTRTKEAQSDAAVARP